ncbi:RT0821/Lpp0805 family surface protein [Methylocella sp.]|uniref:RT0821/Lpp0805 family surface protein n=1 Tax=Methylocella sp. TaxID=1978226 RepID=UPI003783C223
MALFVRLSRHYHRSTRVSSADRSGAAWRHLLSRLLAAGALAAGLGGCAVSMQVAKFSLPDDDATGSIAASPFDALFDAEDWRRARAALSTALDPQGNGAEVGWNNPESGARGAFAPQGSPFPVDGQVCRKFRGDARRKDKSEKAEGTACADKNGDWAIVRARPLAKG